MILYFAIAMIVSYMAWLVSGTTFRLNRGEIQRSWVLDRVLISGIFVILTLLAALRLDVGNDYSGYVLTNHEIYKNGYVVTEPGYNVVIKALYTLSGKEDYLLFFTLFAGAIVFIFLKAMGELSPDFGLSIFLFMTLGLYYRSFNTVRYYLILAVSLYSLKYVIRGRGLFNWQNMVKFLLLIGISATFHKSALVVIPLFAICSLPWNKWICLCLGLLSGAVLVFREQVMALGLKFYPSYLQTEYLEEAHSILENSQIYLRCALVLLLAWWCCKKTPATREIKIMTNMTIMSLFVYACGYYIPFVSRIGYYVLTPQIILIPSLLSQVEDSTERKRLKLMVMATALVYFVFFLLSAHKGFRILPYESFLLHSKEFLDKSQVY